MTILISAIKLLFCLILQHYCQITVKLTSQGTAIKGCRLIQPILTKFYRLYSGPFTLIWFASLALGIVSCHVTYTIQVEQVSSRGGLAATASYT